MKCDFYDLIGVDSNSDIEVITTALYSKLEEINNNKDVRLWNYLLRVASELKIQVDIGKLASKQEVSEEFWEILGVGPDTAVEDVAVLLNDKYNDPEVLTDIRVWNFLHRESQKLGINVDTENTVSKKTK